MKQRLVGLSSLALIFFAQGCQTQKEKGESADKMVAAANDLDKKFAEAFNKGDVNALMDTYWNSPELVSVDPGSANPMNFEEAKKAWGEFLNTSKGAAISLTNSKNRAEGSVVLGSGNWTITLPDSAHTTITGRYIDIKAQKDGKWVYVADHASVPMAPPPPPAAPSPK